MTGPAEWLVGLVLGVDALVIAGILVSRLTGRSRRRNGNASADDRVASDRFETYAASDRDATAASSDMAAATAVAEPAADEDVAESVLDAEVAEPAAESAFAGSMPNDGDVTTAPTADYEALADVPSDESSDIPADAPEAFVTTNALAEEPQPDISSTAATDRDAAVAETPAIPERGLRPVGLDFGPTWVDPVTMAAEAAAEWRRGLRRDLALAAWRGRPGLVMNLKLDVESQPESSIAEVARFEAQLPEAIRRLVRATDHFDRTGPGRFHVILSEMPESAALAVAERIRHGFADSAGDPAPRLLIGWAAMEGEGDIAIALQRAAERLDGLPPTDQAVASTRPGESEEPGAPADDTNPGLPSSDAPTYDATTNGRAWSESPARDEA